MTEITNDLIEQVKKFLKITWDDSETKNNIEMIVADAIDSMNHYLGTTEIEYTAPSAYRQLFNNFCLYAWNGCQEQFEDAYKSELNRCRDRLMIEKRMKADETES